MCHSQRGGASSAANTYRLYELEGYALLCRGGRAGPERGYSALDSGHAVPHGHRKGCAQPLRLWIPSTTLHLAHRGPIHRACCDPRVTGRSSHSRNLAFIDEIVALPIESDAVLDL
jgi:hypothetical protein